MEERWSATSERLSAALTVSPGYLEALGCVECRFSVHDGTGVRTALGRHNVFKAAVVFVRRPKLSHKNTPAPRVTKFYFVPNVLF